MLFPQLYFSLEIEVALRRNIFSQFLWQFLWHGNFPNLLTSTLTYSIFLVECSFIIPYFIFTGHVCFMYSRNYRFNWHPKQIWGYLQKREGKKVKIAVMYILEMLQIQPKSKLIEPSCFVFISFLCRTVNILLTFTFDSKIPKS